MNNYKSISFLVCICMVCQTAKGKEVAYVTVNDTLGTQVAVIDLKTRKVLNYIPIGPDAIGGNIVLTPDGVRNHKRPVAYSATGLLEY